MSEIAAPSRFSIVLIRPDSPKNIGLAAQGMAKTWVTDLRGDGLADSHSRRIGHRVGEYEYYLRKLKEHNPRQSASRKGEFGTRKSRPFIGSEKGGQPAKTEYILGAVLARLVRGRDGTVHLDEYPDSDRLSDDGL